MTVELVVATPLLGLLVMLVIQFALWWHAEHVAQAAATQALAAARVEHATATAGQTQAEAILGQVGGRLLVDPRVRVTRDSQHARVTVDAGVETLIPGMRLRVHATAHGDVEHFTAYRGAGGPVVAAVFPTPGPSGGGWR